MATDVLSETVRAEAAGAVLCWLATVDGDGFPSVSPKELWGLAGDAVVIADIASANSIRNIRACPKVCVSFVDVFRQKGFKLYGEARLLAPDHPEFAVAGHDLLAVAGERFRIRHVIEVGVTRAVPIIAPSYHLVAGTTEADMIAQAHATYGVGPSRA